MIALALLAFGPCAADALAAASCGLPLSAGPAPRTNDCLFVLRAAVGLESCRPCVCDTVESSDVEIGASDAHACLQAAVRDEALLSCPACLETTTTLEPPTTTTTTISPTTTLPDPCPSIVEWTTHAGYGAPCASNADCAAGACDGATARCRTPTDFDPGWTGYGHDQDLHDGTVHRLRVECDGEGPVCGSCNVVGIDPSAGNCRCAADVRVACDQPFGDDADCPGGGACWCHASAPLPISAGGTPYCLVELFDAEPSGTVDVDLGSITITSARRTRVHLGASIFAPCPTCGGRCSDDPAELCDREDDCGPGATCELDDVAGDGIRGGVCGAGQNQGQSCDVGAYHSSFPARLSGGGGGGYSIDCQPSVGTNVSGTGTRIRFTETTGASSLAANLPCSALAPEELCPCRACSTDPTVPCSSEEDCAGLDGACSGSSRVRCATNGDCGTADGGACHQSIHRCTNATAVSCETNADCTGLDLGTCVPPGCATGTAASPLPNSCEGFSCTDDGSGEAGCTTGPDWKFCSGVLTAAGDGVVACATDDDCLPWLLDGPSTCSHVERARCFVDPVAAEGSADPGGPLLVSTHCAPATTKTSFNELLGLPGPVRTRRQTTMRAFCAADPAKPYEPGVGGCSP